MNCYSTWRKKMAVQIFVLVFLVFGEQFATQHRSHMIWEERRECLPVRATRSLQDEYVSGISEASIRKFKVMWQSHNTTLSA